MKNYGEKKRQKEIAKKDIDKKEWWEGVNSGFMEDDQGDNWFQ